MPISENDYPFRLEVTSQARREIGHAIAREHCPELRILVSRGEIAATLQHVDHTLDRVRHRLTRDTATAHTRIHAPGQRPNNVTATHGGHKLE